MTSWKPIETAPRSGRLFDAWCVHPNYPGHGVRITDVQMRGDGSGFGFIVDLPSGVRWQYLDARDEDSIFPEWIPTHWMEIPEGPTT